MSKKYDFIAIDCEKASNNATSLCSIGIACFKGGRVKATKEYIIKPVPFEFYAGSIIDDAYHNVPLKVYENAPTIVEIWPKIEKYFKNNIIVGHGVNGDMQAIQWSLEYYGKHVNMPGPDQCICTNIASIYTYPWIESHKLRVLCENLNIPVNPHHALSDAKASGFLLLDMLNVTDCKTARDFIDVCTEYNSMITTKYTDRNIEKYEEEIKEIFGYNPDTIDLIYKNRMAKINEIIEYFKKFKPDYEMPELKIVNCVSPIIEIFKNEDYKDYIDELDKLMPFTHDSFMYLKTGAKEYTLFFGLLTTKIELIYQLFLFLTRISIPVCKTGFISVAYKRIQKYRQTVYLMSNYLFEVDGIEEADIYKYIEGLYTNQLQQLQSYDFEKGYEKMLINSRPQQSIDFYKKAINELSKLIGFYLGLTENFPTMSENLSRPQYFNTSFSLFNKTLELFASDDNSKEIYNSFEYLLEKWYSDNVGSISF